MIGDKIFFYANIFIFAIDLCVLFINIFIHKDIFSSILFAFINLFMVFWVRLSYKDQKQSTLQYNEWKKRNLAATMPGFINNPPRQQD
jgi:hypothetical protein